MATMVTRAVFAVKDLDGSESRGKRAEIQKAPFKQVLLQPDAKA
jgi:hypothetical protein